MDQRPGSMSAFDFDIFISYAHADNVSEGDPDGWIDQLHRGIENWAFKITGKNPSSGATAGSKASTISTSVLTRIWKKRPSWLP